MKKRLVSAIVAIAITFSTGGIGFYLDGFPSPVGFGNRVGHTISDFPKDFQEFLRLIIVGTPAVASPSSPPADVLLVRPAVSKQGYSRSFFGRAWTDDNDTLYGHNFCDSRDDIIRIQSKNIVFQGKCKILSAIVFDPYTGTWERFQRGASHNIDIDHVVPLRWAYRTGAQLLSLRERTNFANDPLNLLAVSAHFNRQKGDSPIDAWVPPNKNFRCQYAHRYKAVKEKYHLWVTPSENRTIQFYDQRCTK